MNESQTIKPAKGVGKLGIARVAPFLLLGPISGPFTAGVVLNFREGRPVLGSLYAVALAQWLLIAPIVTVQLLHTSLAHFF